MLERLTQILSHPIDRRTSVITSKQFCRSAAQKCAPKLGAPYHEDLIVDALSGFIEALFFKAPSVEAAAFLSVSSPQCRTSLYVELFAPLDAENRRGSSTVKTAVEADAELARQLSSILSSGASFVDTSHASLESLKDKVWQRWSDDPTLSLARFALFKRG